jgi:uncharacterized protein
MSGKTASRRRRLPGPVYLDSSALAKLYLPEAESEALEAAVLGRRDLAVSDLGITELTSAAARRQRQGELTQAQLSLLYRALLDDLSGDVYLSVALAPAVFREAERFVLSRLGGGLRAADALHLAIALSAGARTLATYDARLRSAAEGAGLHLLSPAAAAD